jgi:integrase
VVISLAQGKPMPPRKLTDDFVKDATAEPGAERTIFWDTEVKRFGLMVTQSGHKSFVLQYRDRATGEQHRLSIPQDAFKVKKAREWARDNKADVHLGGNPIVERRKIERLDETTFKAIAEKYLKMSAKLRSIKLVRSSLERFALPAFGEKQIAEIKKSDISDMRDRVASGSGPGAADYAVSVIARVMNFHERVSDDFKAPSFKGLALQKAAEQARDRILNDDELRAFWKATEGEGAKGSFRPMLRFILLTATRRDEAAEMAWSEIDGKDWVIPKERYKTKTELLIPLSDAAQKVLAGIPRTKSKYVFVTASGKALKSFSAAKAELDEDCGVNDWTIHDLRRTARSLLARAGVSEDHAERCLGHKIRGISGTYNRHAYYDEKKQAFEKLAALVDRIVNPQDNVVHMRTEIPA